MKKILIILTILCSVAVSSQEAKAIEVSEVVKVTDNSATALELYGNAKVWFTKMFKNPKYVIKLDDPESKTLMGTGSLDFQSKTGAGSGGRSGVVEFDIKVVCKDGRYKYEFYNFNHKGSVMQFGLVTDVRHFPELRGLMGGSDNYKTKATEEVQNFVKKQAEVLSASLKLEMDKPVAQKEDW